MATKNYCYRCRSIFFSHLKRCWWCGWRICKHCKACGCQYMVRIARKKETLPSFQKELTPRIVHYRLKNSDRINEQVQFRRQHRCQDIEAKRYEIKRAQAQQLFSKRSSVTLFIPNIIRAILLWLLNIGPLSTKRFF